MLLTKLSKGPFFKNCRLCIHEMIPILWYTVDSKVVSRIHWNFCYPYHLSTSSIIKFAWVRELDKNLIIFFKKSSIESFTSKDSTLLPYYSKLPQQEKKKRCWRKATKEPSGWRLITFWTYSRHCNRIPNFQDLWFFCWEYGQYSNEIWLIIAFTWLPLYYEYPK